MSTETALKKKYRIGSGLAGAATLELDLTIEPDGLVAGSGTITQPVNPPVHLKTRVEGRYENVGDRHLVQAMGYPPSSPNEPIAGPENCKLSMSMDERWDAGTAEFSFLTASGKWVNSGTVAVKPI